MTDEGVAFFGNVNDERDDKIESKFKLWFEDLGINFIVCGRSRDGSDDDDSFAYDDGKSKFLSRMNEYRMLIKEPLERVAESLDNVFSFLNTIQDEDSICTNRASVHEALSVLGQLYDNFDTSEKTQRGDFDDVRSYLFAIGVAQMSAKRQDYENAIERISKLRTRLRADLEALAANVVVNGARKARC